MSAFKAKRPHKKRPPFFYYICQPKTKHTLSFITWNTSHIIPIYIIYVPIRYTYLYRYIIYLLWLVYMTSTLISGVISWLLSQSLLLSDNISFINKK